MLCKIGKSILVVLLIAGVLSSGLILIRPSTTQAAFGDRITISNNQFYAGGQRIWINGANTPWHNWNDFGGNFDYNWWDNHFQELRNNGINATRIWITCSGEVGINIDSNGYVSGATSAHWSHLDSLFQIAQNRGVYIMATLMSFDHFKNTYSTYQRWRNWINSDSNIDSYVNNYLIPFLNRYKNNPYLWSIDLMNEPDWAYEESAISWDRLQMYFAKAGRAIHENSQVLVTVGLAMPKYNGSACGGCQGNKVSDSALQAKVNDPDARLDFYSSHWYPWEYQYWSSPYHKTPSEYGIATDKLNMVGEMPANGVYNSSGQLLLTTTQAYENAYQKGWEGVMAWTSNGVDSNGSLTQLGPATRAFRDSHYDLVFPGGGSSTNTPPPATNTPTPVSGGLVIYDDATAWDNWSWSATVNLNNASPVYAGSKSVAVTLTSAWGALSLRKSPVVSTGGYDRITFWIHGGSGGTRQLKFFTQSQDSGGESSSVNVDAPAGTWTQVTIPLSSLGNPTQIARIILQDRTGASQPVFYVDEIRLVSGSNPTATPAPTNTPTPAPTNTPTPVSGGLVIYDDATTWDNWSWSATVNLNNASPVYAGSKSVAVTLTSAWGALSLRKSPAVSTGGYGRITFWIHGGSGGTRQLKFFTQSQDSGGGSPSVNVDAPAGTWTQVTIPLSSLGNPTQIARIILQDRTGASQPVFYVDEIKLIP